jgi:hypothetical protein
MSIMKYIPPLFGGAFEPDLRLARLRRGFEVNGHPFNGWLAFSAIGQKGKSTSVL